MATGKGTCAERSLDFAGVHDDDLGVGRRRDDLLADQCPAAAFNQTEVGVYFIRAVNGDVEAA